MLLKCIDIYFIHLLQLILKSISFFKINFLPHNIINPDKDLGMHNMELLVRIAINFQNFEFVVYLF